MTGDGDGPDAAGDGAEPRPGAGTDDGTESVEPETDRAPGGERAAGEDDAGDDGATTDPTAGDDGVADDPTTDEATAADDDAADDDAATDDADVVVRLPEAARGEFRDPLGPIYADAGDLLADAGDPVVAVGDIVTYHLARAGRTPDVAVVDGRTERESVDEEVRTVVEGLDAGAAAVRRVSVANPPATLTAGLLAALREALAAAVAEGESGEGATGDGEVGGGTGDGEIDGETGDGDDAETGDGAVGGKTGDGEVDGGEQAETAEGSRARKTVLSVEGEEDLATLPAVVAAPDGASVVYGQPGEGMVLVAVDDAARARVRDLLGLLAGDHDRLWDLLGVGPSG